MLASVYNSETNYPNLENGATNFALGSHAGNFLMLALSFLDQSQLEFMIQFI